MSHHTATAIGNKGGINQPTSDFYIISHEANSQHHHEQDETYFNNHGSNDTIATISQSATIFNQSHNNESAFITQIPIYAGTPQAAQEANTSNTANEFIRAAANRAQYATGEPWEATQQASNERGSISADAIKNLAMEPSNKIHLAQMIYHSNSST